MTALPDSRLVCVGTDRRAALARFCADLRSRVAGGSSWGSEAVVVPWQATAPSFEALPERIVSALLDEWDDAGASLVEFELNGYLETDAGPRAWGCLVVDPSTPNHGSMTIDDVSVEPVESGVRIEARILADGVASGATDA